MSIMDLASIASVVAINSAIAIRSTLLIKRRRIAPSLAMWVFFTIAIVGSLVTYLADGTYSLLDNILNTADVLMVIIVALAIYIWGDVTTRFNRFDLCCLATVVVILVVWAMSSSHVVAHSLIQAILLVSYLPVVRRIILAQEKTESYLVWTLMMVAPGLSLLSSNGYLATVYAIRAMLSAAVLIIVMVLSDRRRRRASANVDRCN